jgi:hypothetical protein
MQDNRASKIVEKPDRAYSTRGANLRKDHLKYLLLYVQLSVQSNRLI